MEAASGHSLLEVDGLSVFYAGAMALNDISLSVAEGESVSIIGPNGAGKTSLLRAISGLVPFRGQVRLAGRALAGLSPAAIVRLGLAHCPEAAQLFGEMSVEENLALGAFTVRDPATRREALDAVYALFPILAERRRQKAETLSGGERQMVAVGRSLMSRPRLLMLDEPSLGLAPMVRERIQQSIREVHQRWGMTVVLVEQETTFALELAERVYVLDSGHVVKEGLKHDIAEDPAIRSAYLGLT